MDLTQKTQTFYNEDQTWLGSAHGTQATQPATLDIDQFTEATHYPNGYLPSGIPLGYIDTAQPEGGTVGLYAPYDPDFDADSATTGIQSDGRDTLAGFLFTSIDAGAGTTDMPGAVLEHGRVIVGNLPVAFTPPADTGLFIFA